MIRASLLMVLLLLSSCASNSGNSGSSKPAPGGGGGDGIPANCEIRVGDTCYQEAAEACAAVDCPMDRCLILESYPGQVQCQDEPAAGSP